MAYIILQSRRTRQPQSVVRIDWNNPLANGLVVAVVPSIGLVNLARTSVGSGSATRTVVNGNVNFRCVTSDPVYFPSTFGINPANPMSGYVRGSFNASGSTSFIGNRSGGGFGWYTSGNADVVRPSVILWGVTDQPASTTTGTFYNSAFNIQSSIGFTHTAATTGGMLHYVKGAQLGTAVNTGTPTAGSSTLGYLHNGDGTGGSTVFDNQILLLWNRALSADDHRRIEENPWQIFAPDVRRIYFGAGGGTTTVDGTASITPSPQTLTGAGAVAIAGSATVTPAAQTATTAATVAVAGTAGIAPAAQTLSATGAVVSGVVGSASITPAAQTLTSGATVAISATATITPSAQTLTGSAAVTGGTVTGTATITPAEQTLSATAEVSGGTVTGTANVYVNAQTLLALADIIVDGAATITPAAQTLLGLEAGSLPLEVPESSRILIDRIERLGVSPTVYDPLTNRRVPASRKPPRLG